MSDDQSVWGRAVAGGLLALLGVEMLALGGLLLAEGPIELRAPRDSVAFLRAKSPVDPETRTTRYTIELPEKGERHVSKTKDLHGEVKAKVALPALNGDSTPISTVRDFTACGFAASLRRASRESVA